MRNPRLGVIAASDFRQSYYDELILTYPNLVRFWPPYKEETATVPNYEDVLLGTGLSTRYWPLNSEDSHPGPLTYNTTLSNLGSKVTRHWPLSTESGTVDEPFGTVTWGAPASSADSGTTRTASVPYPQSNLIDTDDVLLLFATKSNAASWPAISGWSLQTGGERGALYWRLASGRDTGTVAVSCGATSSSIVGAMCVVHGAATVSPFAGSASVTSQSDDQDIRYPGITPSVQPTVVFASAHGLRGSQASPVVPSGSGHPTYSLALDSQDTFGAAVCRLVVFTGSSTSTSSWTTINATNSSTLINFHHGMTHALKGP
jgi:hypothetical protein